MQLPDLPIRAVLERLAECLRDGRGAVLVAPPGAGKTTVVPLGLLHEPWLAGLRLVMLEPRRLAARAAASRMARSLGERVGETVGYRIRGDTRTGPRTRIEVVTEGVLTRLLQSDPSLEGIGAVLFDEFHERSIHADLGLALALESRRLFREDLRLLVMSATLEAEPVAELLDGAPVVRAEGRSFPVETRYLDRPVDDPVAECVPAVLRALGDSDGDVLVFLPGVGEIRRVASRLEPRLEESVRLAPLFGTLAQGDQDAAIEASPPGRRKVVLATAIAQTSLTIEGVRVVVDSGLVRLARFDPGSGMTGLVTQRVTRDVAEQRRGRAGRVAPGVCHRLWTEGENRGLLAAQRPEILDADLAPLLLEVAAWGAAPGELSWLDEPPSEALEQARELLHGLDALDPQGSITLEGRRMATLAAHPRVAHLLLRARESGYAALACDLAALLGERDPIARHGEAPDADLRLRLELLRQALRGGGQPAPPMGHRLHRGGFHRVRQEARAWRRRLGVSEPGAPSEAVERVGELLALAYPDRVAQRRGEPAPGVDRVGYRLRNGRGAYLPGTDSLVRHPWLVVSDLDDRYGDARIFRAAPIEVEAVRTRFAASIERVEEVVWDAGRGRVVASRRERLGALELSSSALRHPDSARVAGALLQGVRGVGIESLPWTKATRQLRERLAFLHHADPEGWPDVSEAALLDGLESWLLPFVEGMRSLEDLRRLALDQVLWTHVGWERRTRLDELAPTHLEVPSGSRIPVDYSDAEAPALAVRLQEIFGWTRTPRIAGGRVAVTLRLLSPAQRPVQVTRDLESFWEAGYFEVKKDLKGRYPKHYWPEDPLTATPTRRVRPRDDG